MPVLLINYDVNIPGDRRKKLRDHIKKTYDYQKLSESSYAIISDNDPEDIYNRLEEYLDANDFLLVISIFNPIAGQHKTIISDWLEENLTDCPNASSQSSFHGFFEGPQ